MISTRFPRRCSNPDGRNPKRARARARAASCVHCLHALAHAVRACTRADAAARPHVSVQKIARACSPGCDLWLKPHSQYGPMNLHRFRLFSDFLHQAGPDAYNLVLMSDVRDVYFQLDPFETLRVGSGLGVAVEPAHLTIGGCEIHSRWLSDECSSYQVEGVLAALAHRSRSCAGTTIGTQEAVDKYCTMILHEARRTVREVSAEAAKAFDGRITTFDGSRWWGWCNDQAMHNVLLWTGQFDAHMNVTLFDAESSPLATVGTMKMLHTNADGELLTGCLDDKAHDCDAAQIAALVHQYDRVDMLVRLVQGLYGLPGEVFQTFQERHLK
eukprot:Tamp_15448.p1 GENE.Tamp_15448~~Tamp_15448.p1  ORF type:complete len:328 (+),score=31.45 Tamp_15448:418-1401(+)